MTLIRIKSFASFGHIADGVEVITFRAMFELVGSWHFASRMVQYTAVCILQRSGRAGRLEEGITILYALSKIYDFRQMQKNICETHGNFSFIAFCNK